MRTGIASHQPEDGFTFLGLMFLIAVMGIVASAAASTWAFTSQRDKEVDLLFAGHAYREAIMRYAAAHARERQPYPLELSQLLGGSDRLVPVRFLRRLYFDPMTGGPDWGLVRTPDGGITGVYSLSTRKPLRIVSVEGRDDGIDFARAKTYSNWVFGVNPALANGDGAPSDGRYQNLPPGWDPARDGAPPAQWDAAHPKPQPTGN